MEMIFQFAGKLHPLLVHLPIGFLLMGIILMWWHHYSRKDIGTVLPLIFLLGSISAILSCVTGFILFSNGDYDIDLANGHRNAGIILTILSIIIWWLFHKDLYRKMRYGLALAIFSMLIITGHQGGSLTHGSEFLFNTVPAGFVIKPIENPDEAYVYEDVIHPILEQKCTGCHGPEKQKGKLRLDSEQFILKGGKDGKAIVAGNIEKSEMLNRILLPPDDEDHMPPKEKGQLTSHQKELIKWWISTGASFKAKVKDLAPDASIRPALASLRTGGDHSEEQKTVPNIQAASAELIATLQKAGVVIVPVSQQSNQLTANLINCTVLNDTILNGLVAISPQLIWLKAEGLLVDDNAMKYIGKCKNLEKLSLANSSITEASIPVLKEMKNLRSLNVYGTRISDYRLSQ